VTARDCGMRRALRWGVVLSAAVLLVAAAVLLGPPPPEGPPLHPGSVGPNGTRAVIDLLRVLGNEVDVVDAATPPAGDTALLLTDTFTDQQRGRLEGWVDGGGRLVVTDPRSPLAPPEAGPTVPFLAPPLERDCDSAALGDVEWVRAPDGVALEAPDGAMGCFRHGAGHWLVLIRRGDGVIAAVGGPGWLTNHAIDEADNPLLAVALLAPAPPMEVTVYRPGLPGEGEATLADLVPLSVKLALVQLGIGFLLLAWWRGRRLGKPVLEPQPVELPGAQLVTAVGGLLQRTGARGQAAQVLRQGLRRDLAARLGLPADADRDHVADAASARGGVDRGRVAAVLSGPDPADDAGLLRLAVDLEHVRRAVVGGPDGTPAAASGVPQRPRGGHGV
jgi:hypothetical protein